MSAEPSRKRKLSVTSVVAQSSRGPQKGDSCAPGKNRKLRAVSKVSAIFQMVPFISHYLLWNFQPLISFQSVWKYFSSFFKTFFRCVVLAVRDREVHNGQSYKEVSNLKFSNWAQTNYCWTKFCLILMVFVFISSALNESTVRLILIRRRRKRRFSCQNHL